jgi:hypothetical protein
MFSSSMPGAAIISGPSASTGPVADLFNMQDEIVARLAGQLGAQFIALEARRTEGAPHPDSMDLCFLGMACVNKGWTAEFVLRARGFFERALSLGAGNVDALVGTAIADAMIGTGLMARDRTARLALDPVFTRAGAATENPNYLAGREHIYEGLRKAGVPEG